MYNHYQAEINPNGLQQFHHDDTFYRQQPQYYPQTYPYPHPLRCRWVRRCYPRDDFHTEGHD
ncbi:hypothetical protein [Priestia filamentosa]|uniref:hypothetical protein n=1 Tax=Priestia filamentosa TaxID=1402861 RepID=UPI0009EF6BDA|nr:hypothetical protein [Priestia filamentosa]